MIGILSEQQSYELLTSTTVGRIGFLAEGRVEIHPVNYVLSDRDLILRTAPDSPLLPLAEAAADVAFEVDHHTDIAGSAWSVLLHGPLTRVAEEEADALAARVSPWAGADRWVPLRFTIESITGRSVQRDRR
ncbi:pyridoxamine 5'-phosphate oxidase family protein [Microbacterium tumbae]